MIISVYRKLLATSITSGILLLGAGGAQAFTFTTNDFTGSNQPDPFQDILLESVTLDSAEFVTDFSFVSLADIIHNDPYTGDNTGAASTDKGDLATAPLAPQEDPSGSDVAAYLSNANLNNIIDTEDDGSFEMDLTFAKAMDNLLIWERGMNSDLAVQAVDDAGNLLGQKYTVSRNDWAYAGFDIDTQEIREIQKVGAFGINVASDLGVNSSISKLRVFSDSQSNGPDWKIVGTDANRESVPEPGLMMGLLLVGGLAATQRARQH